MKQKVAAKANLIALLDNTYPGVNKLFDSPPREDGSEKWVDYAYSFWHVDCVRRIGLNLYRALQGFLQETPLHLPAGQARKTVPCLKGIGCCLSKREDL